MPLMAGESDASLGPDSLGSRSLPRGAFQLQTTAIRNSAPFRSKSADVFASLDKLEKGLGGQGPGGALKEEEEETEAEEGQLDALIRRGCIFKKPPASAGLGPQGSSQDGKSGRPPRAPISRSTALLPHPGRISLDAKPGDLVPGNAPRSKPDASGKPATAASSSEHPRDPGRSSEGGFRRPWSRDATGPGRRRGGGRQALSKAPRGRHRTPDHVLNPHKYTEYSLEETNMSGNTANQSIALGFLSDLRKRKAAEMEDDLGGCDSGQVIFKKPTSSTGSKESEEHPFPSGKKNYGSIYKMPEYEVGKGRDTKPKRPRMIHSEETEEASRSSVTAFALDHLAAQQPVDSHSSSQVDAADLSAPSEAEGQGITNQSDQGETLCPGGFKVRKGKGKRQIRGRQEEAT